MGRLQIRAYLAVRVGGITEKQVADFCEPQYETDANGDFVWELPETDEQVIHLEAAKHPRKPHPSAKLRKQIELDGELVRLPEKKWFWEWTDQPRQKRREVRPSMEDAPDQPEDEPAAVRQWRLVVRKRRRRRMRWMELLSDLTETESRIRDPHQPIGHEFELFGKPRYTSKTQPNQALSLITKKQRQ